MESTQFDLVVIGGGPAGYTAAIRAAQLDFKVACIESEAALGGTCLRVGCIPSKALLESSELYIEAKEKYGEFGIKIGAIELDLAAMLRRKDQTVKTMAAGIEFLFKKRKVARFQGHGKIIAPGRIAVESSTGTTELEAKHTLICTGSKVAKLRGVEFHGDLIGTSTEALTYPEVPKHLVVIGAGVIGLELGSVWRRLGAKVTVLEYLDRIFPEMDFEIAKEAQKLFEKQGIEFRLGSRVTGARVQDGRCIVEADGQAPIECDRVLVAVGRVPNTDGLGLENIGVQVDKRGRIAVDPHYQSSVPGIYAVGDVIDGPMLAHKAEEEAAACVEYLKTGYCHVNYDAIPSVVYTAPEIASVGKSEEQLKAAGIEYKRGVFPFLANGRARALGHTDGRAKVLADAQTDRILGVHIIGPRAGDLIAEAAVAIEFGASAEDLGRACHAHPTLAEVVKEASLDVQKRAINI